MSAGSCRLKGRGGWSDLSNRMRGRLAALERRDRPGLDRCRCAGLHPRILVVEGEGPLPAVEQSHCLGRAHEVVYVRIVDRPACDGEDVLVARNAVNYPRGV